MHNSHGIDLILWNSFMGKAYSVSDCFKENGIGILARACKDAGFDFMIEDPARIEFYTSFAESGLTPQLSRLAGNVFNRQGDKDTLKWKSEWNRLQADVSRDIRGKMDGYISGLAQKVKTHRARVLGIKTWLGDRFTYSEKLAQEVRKCSPDTLIVAGGPQVNQFKINALEKSPFDFCVDVEGETTLIKIIRTAREMYSQGYKKPDVIKKITALAESGEIFNSRAKPPAKRV